MRPRTWKVVEWPERQTTDDGEPLPLTCLNCERDALCPTAGRPGDLIIAILGMGIVFDHPAHVPPRGWLPNTIECRGCGHVYTDLPEVEADQEIGAVDVREAP